jgi:hypothetical protein
MLIFEGIVRAHGCVPTRERRIGRKGEKELDLIHVVVNPFIHASKIFVFQAINSGVSRPSDP